LFRYEDLVANEAHSFNQQHGDLIEKLGYPVD